MRNFTGWIKMDASNLDGVQLRDSLALPISRTYNQINAAVSAIARQEADLGLTEWRMMVFLGEGQADTSAQIAQKLLIDGGQVSRSINALIDRGLICTKMDQKDRRVRRIVLTSEGFSLYQKIAPIASINISRLKCDFPPEQVKIFLSMLAKIEAAAASISTEYNGR
jgi:DNA-binding MarR family transcriptional regulator